MKIDFLVVGAGFAGAVIAERIASQLDKKVLLVEKRNHIGGNAYDELDDNGILVHRYGPHIFHTNSSKVFNYLSKFTEWIQYEHRVLANHKNKLYPIPINRITLNELYNAELQSENEVKEYFEKVKVSRSPALNSEDIIVNQVGLDLFEIFFKNYTKKQWGLYPIELSSSICGRIPVRTNDDCRYFTDEYQFMPKDGYTKMFKKILSHKNIEVATGTDYKQVIDSVEFGKLIFTGPIDSFFDYEYGKLPYRSLRFEFEYHDINKYQVAPVINFVDKEIEYSRITEYKYLTGQISKGTTISREFFTSKGDPFYPVLTDANVNAYKKYSKLADDNKNTFFIGRLAEYKYYNMDQVVARSLSLLEKIG